MLTAARQLPMAGEVPPTYARAFVVEHRRETQRHGHAAPRDRRPGPPRRPARPVRDGRPARLLGGADLRLALPSGRPRADDPCGRAGDPRLCGLRRGDSLGLRGPLGAAGRSRPPTGRDVIVITGGIGLAPLRPLIDASSRDRVRFREIRLMYGARTPGRSPVRRRAVGPRRSPRHGGRPDRRPGRAGMARAGRGRDEPLRCRATWTARTPAPSSAAPNG